LGNRKGIWCVNNPGKILLLDFERPGLTWSDIQKNVPVRRKPKVLVVVVSAAAAIETGFTE